LGWKRKTALVLDFHADWESVQRGSTLGWAWGILVSASSAASADSFRTSMPSCAKAGRALPLGLPYAGVHQLKPPGLSEAKTACAAKVSIS